MFEATWFILNVIFGVPLAVILLGLGREGLRALIALAFGFRVFQMKWGAGRRVWVKTIGPVEFVLGSLPIVGSVVAASGSPKRHHLSRLSQASGPLLFQIAVASWGNLGDLMIEEPFRSGFAPSSTFQLANILLILLHGLLPLESKSGFRTDIRSILDVGFGRGELDRHARASYYARYARHWMERADVDQAKAVLERGLTQLGRDPLLVACEAQIGTEDLSSVVDQSRCADALRSLIQDAEPRRAKTRETWSVHERIRQSAITSLPLMLAIPGVFALNAEQFSLLAQQHLMVTGDTIASTGVESACEDQLTRWRRWSPAIDLALPDDPERERDRHDQMAQLERCRGELKAAAAHRAIAILAAERALTRPTGRTQPDPNRWLANEIHLAIALRRAARLDSELARYRLALAGLARAVQGLDLAQNRVSTRPWQEPESKGRANELLASERARLERTRLDVLLRMGAIANRTTD
jgi:hypothetical protein